jgi:hypothetical protein
MYKIIFPYFIVLTFSSLLSSSSSFSSQFSIRFFFLLSCFSWTFSLPFCFFLRVKDDEMSMYLVLFRSKTNKSSKTNLIPIFDEIIKMRKSWHSYFFAHLYHRHDYDGLTVKKQMKKL